MEKTAESWIGLSVLASLPWYAMSTPRATSQAPHICRCSIQDPFESRLLLQRHGLEHGYNVCRCHTTRRSCAILHRFRRYSASWQFILCGVWPDICVRSAGRRVSLQPKRRRSTRAWLKKHPRGNASRCFLRWLYQPVSCQGGRLGEARLQSKYCPNTKQAPIVLTGLIGHKSNLLEDEIGERRIQQCHSQSVILMVRKAVDIWWLLANIHGGWDRRLSTCITGR